MRHRYPKWLVYMVLVLMVASIGACAHVLLKSALFSGTGANIAFCLIGAALLVFLVWSYLHVIRYSVEVGSEDISITRAFRTRAIPLNSIAQVITASAPRGGTDSWLFDKSDTCLAKLDGGLIGFEALMLELGKGLHPYQALFYRRDSWGLWEMQVAGDTKWVRSEAPALVQRNSRRVIRILAVGLVAIALAVGFTAWR